MASEVPSMPGANGTFTQHQNYEQQQQSNGTYAQNGSPGHQAPFSQTPSTSQTADISKDEVGWYFVEQYYTTLSRNPSKLYLFYNKRSQFVSGLETDKVAVCVGQRAIADRITDLEFQDCKVRVTNVDSQASDSNIVIQVIGEISNKQQAHRKFTQTFVLAAQTNGYFVLNDIFRYLIEEEAEAEPEQEHEAATQAEDVQPTATAETQESVTGNEKVPELKALPSSADPDAIERHAQVVDREIEEKLIKEEENPAEDDLAVNGVNGGEHDLEKENTADPTAPIEPAAGEDTQATIAQTPENPHEPEPTPVSSPPPQAAAQPTAPAKAAVPRSWASLAASAHKVATPVAPSAASSATSQQPRSSASKATNPAPATTNAPSASSAPTAPAAQRDQSPAANSQDEWTAVGGNHNRQQSRQTNTQPPETPQVRAYIKNIREEMDAGALKAYLEKFGEITHFDIARQKVGPSLFFLSRPRTSTDSILQNCAFVDFKTPEQYQAAVAANPHTVDTEKFWVEERRPRPGNTFVPRAQFQGGRGGRGGNNQGGPQRGGMQGAPRGNYAQRSRGGPAASRGRGVPAPPS
nr:putative g3bp-like protein [Quercus suber]